MAQNIELGGGESPLEGYQNMDARYGNDMAKPWEIDSDSIDNIYSREFIEHISYLKIEDVLKESYRVLKIGGRFSFSCPDFEKLIERFNSKPNEEELVYLRRSILGDGTTEFDYHRNIVWFDYIKELMEKIGFKEVKRLDQKAGFKQSTKLNVEGYKL